MPLPSFLRRLSPHPAFLYVAAGLFLSFATLLVFLHASVIRFVQEEAVPLALRLPSAEVRLERLQEQLEVAELEEVLRGSPSAEMLYAFVVPREDDLDRLLFAFDVLRDWLASRKLLSNMSPVRVSEATDVTMTGDNGQEIPLTSRTLSFEVSVTPEGKEMLLAMIDFAGALTVSDVLSPAELDMLLTLTEQENPAAISVLEQQFLSIDLLRYAREPKPFDEQLLKSFTSETFAAAFRTITQDSHLRTARDILGGEFGALLDRHELWPLRFLGIKRIDTAQEGGTVRMSLELEVYARK